MQPGSVITPGSSPEEPKTEQTQTAPTEAPAAQQPQAEPTPPAEPVAQVAPPQVEQPQESSQPSQPTNPSSEEPPAPQEPAPTQMDTNAYSPLETEDPAERPHDFAAPEISWSASEYIAHHKDVTWFVALAVVGLVVTGLVYLITQDLIAALVFPVITLLFGIFAARKPQVLQYVVHADGISIGNRAYAFEDFKSFSVHQDATLPSALFWPTKRFMPGLTVYFPPNQADEIINTLSVYLPHQDHEPDAVDRLMRRVRF